MYFIVHCENKITRIANIKVIFNLGFKYFIYFMSNGVICLFFLHISITHFITLAFKILKS